MSENDSLQRFIFVNSPVRGELIHLNNSYLAVSERHPYPLPVRKLLGETLAAAALLRTTLKFSGSLTLQIHGEGAVKLLVAQADQEGNIRGLADWEGEVASDSFAAVMSKGQLGITLDLSDEGQRYQGIVELQGESLAEALETYFAKSEQLPTFIYLATDEQSVAGMLLQILPGVYDRDPGVAWEHLSHLSRTLTAKEILHLDNQEILTRLFHEEDIQLFDPESIRFYCRCNRERMERAILTMGKKEALELLKEKKVIMVTCEFCNRHLDFDAVDVEKIFAL